MTVTMLATVMLKYFLLIISLLHQMSIKIALNISRNFQVNLDFSFFCFFGCAARLASS